MNTFILCIYDIIVVIVIKNRSAYGQTSMETKDIKNCHQFCGTYSNGIPLYTVTKTLQMMTVQANKLLSSL